MRRGEAEKIGLAHESEEDGAALDPRPSDPGRAASAPTPEDPPRKAWRAHPVLLLVLVLLLLGVSLAFGNQFQKAQQLENRVALLSSELDRANENLAAYERQMESVRTAVVDLSGRMSALQTLVEQPPDSTNP